MTRIYGAIYYQSDGWWYATTEEIDVLVQGTTLEDARAKLADIIRSTVQSRRAYIINALPNADIFHDEVAVDLPPLSAETS